jgi:hypothetical protein
VQFYCFEFFSLFSVFELHCSLARCCCRLYLGFLFFFTHCCSHRCFQESRLMKNSLFWLLDFYFIDLFREITEFANCFNLTQFFCFFIAKC